MKLYFITFLYISGGPITANGIQYGIASWGEGCGLAGFPGVYASVVTQRDWIRKVSGV